MTKIRYSKNSLKINEVTYTSGQIPYLNRSFASKSWISLFAWRRKYWVKKVGEKINKIRREWEVEREGGKDSEREREMNGPPKKTKKGIINQILKGLLIFYGIKLLTVK